MPKTGLPESDTKPQSGAGKHEAASAGASAGAGKLASHLGVAPWRRTLATSREAREGRIRI